MLVPSNVGITLGSLSRSSAIYTQSFPSKRKSKRNGHVVAPNVLEKAADVMECDWLFEHRHQVCIEVRMLFHSAGFKKREILDEIPDGICDGKVPEQVQRETLDDLLEEHH